MLFTNIKFNYRNILHAVLSIYHLIYLDKNGIFALANINQSDVTDDLPEFDELSCLTSTEPDNTSKLSADKSVWPTNMILTFCHPTTTEGKILYFFSQEYTHFIFS